MDDNPFSSTITGSALRRKLIKRTVINPDPLPSLQPRKSRPNLRIVTRISTEDDSLAEEFSDSDEVREERFEEKLIEDKALKTNYTEKACEIPLLLRVRRRPNANMIPSVTQPLYEAILKSPSQPEGFHQRVSGRPKCLPQKTLGQKPCPSLHRNL